MRVLFLADAVFEDLPGGSRVVARELASGLVRRGHDVTFLVVRKKPMGLDETVADGIRVVRFDGGGNAAHYVRAAKVTCARLWASCSYLSQCHSRSGDMGWLPTSHLYRR